MYSLGVKKLFQIINLNKPKFDQCTTYLSTQGHLHPHPLVILICCPNNIRRSLHDKIIFLFVL